mgnify:CR=1 FL=1
MIIYEIDIEIDNSIYKKYIKLLKKHIKIMLLFDGFINANIYLYNNNIKTNVLVHYYVSNIVQLNDYINNKSNKIRSSGIKEFNDLVKIERRVLTEL